MEFKFLNKSSVNQTYDRIKIITPAQTDLFCGSIDEYKKDVYFNVHYYYTETML